MLLLVVPCFNEAKRWNHDYWNQMLSIPLVDWVFIDDGSTDNTAKLLADLCLRSNANFFSLAENSGKGEAIRLGLNSVFEKGKNYLATGFIDADGAFDVSEVADILNKSRLTLSGNEIDSIWTSRVYLAGRNIQRSTLRHYIGRFLATFFSVGVGQIPYDTQCGFKVFKVSTKLEVVLARPFTTRWLFELEMLSRWRKLNNVSLRVWEEPLNAWKEIGDSKITLREIRRIAIEVVQIKVIQLKSNRR